MTRPEQYPDSESDCAAAIAWSEDAIYLSQGIPFPGSIEEFDITNYNMVQAAFHLGILVAREPCTDAACRDSEQRCAGYDFYFHCAGDGESTDSKDYCGEQIGTIQTYIQN